MACFLISIGFAPFYVSHSYLTFEGACIESDPSPRKLNLKLIMIFISTDRLNEHKALSDARL